MQIVVLVSLCLLIATVEGDCFSYEFECINSGTCIYHTNVCNGYDDCPPGDTSDEQNCGTECFSDQYRCSNGYCISFSKRCDGYDDCGDNSDEVCGSSGGNSGGSNSGLAVGLTVLVVFLICCCCGCCGGAAGVSSRERDSVHPEPTIVRVVAFGVAE